ncbi:MAG TPA: tetratricopeptide repeat protein [Verrucomicrobiales bacterium]|nr:tetratricopeptide repeat protein [Verrucomicrobiales bacterium]
MTPILLLGGTLLRHFRCLAAVFALAGIPWSGSAQDSETVTSLFNRGVSHMESDEWEQAHASFSRIVEVFGTDDPMTFYGPQFGVIYYHKGLCEMRLGRYDEAIGSFETCHRQFPNRVLDDAETPSINKYWKVSVFEWAAALQQVEDYESALRKYKEFLELKPEPGSFKPAAYFINIGICYIKSRKVVEGETEIAKAFDKKDEYGATAADLWRALVVLARGWMAVEEGEREATQARGVKFLNTYRHLLAQDHFLMSGYTSTLLVLGQEATKADMSSLALQLYSYVPDSQRAILEADVFHTPGGRMAPADQRKRDGLKAAVDSGDPPEINAFFGIAQAYQNRGDNRAGMVIYEQLANRYLKSKNRPEILHAATAMAAGIGEMLKAQKYGLIFLEQYPEHELKDEVASLLLSSLFYNQEYEKCVEIAGQIRVELTLGSRERDLPDFVYGGSMYYLGKYEEAQPELDLHVENYEASPYRENSTYYQASNLVKRFYWKEAAEKLDAWLVIYEPKDSALLDVAYLDRASCHFALATEANGGMTMALDLIEKVLTKFPDSQVLDRAHNLAGDIHQSEQRFAPAEESYLKGLETAEALEHAEIAAGGLSQLVPVCLAQEKYKEAISYYDAFFSKYPNSFHAPNVAVTGLRAFREGDPKRLAEAVDRVIEIVVALGEAGDSAGLEQAINSFIRFQLEDNKPVDVIDQLDAIQRQHSYRTLQAWLLVAKIGIIEEHLTQQGPMRARLQVYYDELENSFKKEELGNYILARVGINIAEANLFRARPWFEEILKRENPDFQAHAALWLAKMDAKSTDPATRQQAVEKFRRVRDDFQIAELAEDATTGLARLYHEDGKWKEANVEWERYMANRQWTRVRPEAAFFYAESFEKLNELDNAVRAYTAVYALHAPVLDYSAEAVLRVGQIQWNRGFQEEAFKIVNEAYRRMKTNKHRLVEALGRKVEEFRAGLKQAGKWKASLDPFSGS